MVEFAVAFPVAALLLVGLVSLGDALSINRKVSIATQTVTDLVTRSATLTQADMTAILNASSAIMAPYPTTTAVVTVTEVSTDDKGNGTVTWSSALNGSPLQPGVPVTLPPGLMQPNISVIWGQVSYRYSSYLGSNVVGPINMSDQIFLAPRVSASIPAPS